MKAGQAKLEIQKILGIPESEQFPNIGPKTKAQLALLAKQSNDSEWPLSFDTERHVNQDGLELIKHFEGLYLKAYKDPVGIWTIGYGHTGLTHQDGTVYEGRKITKAEAEQLLRYDLGVFEKRVKDLITVPLNDNQFSALVSFDFNTGGLAKSTLRKKLNVEDYLGAADELLKWDKAGGRTLAGLTRRRKSERNLFLDIQPYIVQ